MARWATRKRKKLDKLSSKKTCASHAKIGHTLIHHYPSTIPFPLRPRLMMSNTTGKASTVELEMKAAGILDYGTFAQPGVDAGNT